MWADVNSFSGLRIDNYILLYSPQPQARSTAEQERSSIAFATYRATDVGRRQDPVALRLQADGNDPEGIDLGAYHFAYCLENL